MNNSRNINDVLRDRLNKEFKKADLLSVDLDLSLIVRLTIQKLMIEAAIPKNLSTLLPNTKDFFSEQITLYLGETDTLRDPSEVISRQVTDTYMTMYYPLSPLCKYTPLDVTMVSQVTLIIILKYIVEAKRHKIDRLLSRLIDVLRTFTLHLPEQD